MSKPTGEHGFVRVESASDGSLTSSFIRTPFPSTKQGVEQFVAHPFLRVMPRCTGREFWLSNLRQNQEDDFDFCVDSVRGPAYLELLEIAPLKGPYDQAPASHNPYDLASAILENILKKSARYPRRDCPDIYLLLYATHWAFSLSTGTLHCLQYWLQRRSTAFRAIFSFTLLTAEAGQPVLIAPFPPSLPKSFDPKRLRKSVVHNLSPNKWELHPQPNPQSGLLSGEAGNVLD